MSFSSSFFLFFFCFCRNCDGESEESEVGLSETSAKSSRFYNAITEGSTLGSLSFLYANHLIYSLKELCSPSFFFFFFPRVIIFKFHCLGTPAFQREPLMSWNLGLAYEVAKEWAKERAAETGTSPLLDNLSILHLPVGVRPSEELKDNANISLTTQTLDPETEGDAKAEPVVNSSISSWSELTDAGFEAVKDFCNNTFTSFKGNYVDITKKQGDLSVRAASMLVICYS